MRRVGDIDNWKELETGATSTDQKRVRGVETVGGRERAEDRGSEIRDDAATIRQSLRKRGSRGNTRWMSMESLLRQSWTMT